MAGLSDLSPVGVGVETAVEVALDDLLDDMPEMTVLLLETALVDRQENVPKSA
jgi:hypothetical protein